MADPLELGFSTFSLNRVNRSGIIGGGIIGGHAQGGPGSSTLATTRRS